MTRRTRPTIHAFSRPDFRKSTVARVEVGTMRALYVGPPLGVGFHRGAVACFALALDGRLEVSSDSPAARSGSVGSALVGAGLRHEIRVAGARAAVLYLDATDALAAQLRARMRAIHPHLHVAHPGAPAFRRALERGAGLGAFPPVSPRRVDPRIERVVSALRRGALLDRDVGDVARTAGLSASRFMHLFRAEVGVPFRRYRLWSRLGAAVSRFASGARWTDAALDSQFASSSHFSDAFRAMFGVSPSTLGAVALTLVDARSAGAPAAPG
jgi:AraC-like DNA-binding protein